MIDFSELALSPNQSRAARNFLGLSQAQAAAQSNLPAHKLKRFETGNYVPDSQFLDELREFYEGAGYNFHDEDAPGAKAKRDGDVFPAGVVGGAGSSPNETDGFSMGKPTRAQTANLQFMRISPALSGDQIDHILDCIQDNEDSTAGDLAQPVINGFLSDSPSAISQAHAVAALRRLAENGVLHAKLLGRDVLPATTAKPGATAATVGDLLQAALGDMLLAVVDGDKEAQARRKARAEPAEVLQALVG